MTLAVTPRNKQQEKVLKVFMTSLDISFHSEEDEDKALLNAMQKGRNTALLNDSAKNTLFQKLKAVK